MVGHQREGENLGRVLGEALGQDPDDCFQDADECFVIFVFVEEGLPPVAAIESLVNHARFISS